MKFVNREQIQTAVLNMLNANMGIKPGESLLVVTDVASLEQWSTKGQPLLLSITQRSLLAKMVAEITGEHLQGVPVSFTPFLSTGQNGAEPPLEVAAQMKSADVVVIITSFSLTHTDARLEACKAGARVASMPRFVPEMFHPGGPMDTDYKAIERLSQQISNLLTPARQVHITCPAGTDIIFSIEGRPGQVDAGIYTKSGAWGNLPAGEAYCVPLEGTAEGEIHVTPGWYAALTDPLTLLFEKGSLKKIHGGGDVGVELGKILRPATEAEPYTSRRNLAELGIGTNPNASLVDITLEAEKIKGTIHLAVGDNSHMGGLVNTDYHQDFIIPKANLTLDGRPLMQDGELVAFETENPTVRSQKRREN